MENQLYELTEREEWLVFRGYNYQDVQRLCYFDENTIKEVSKKIFDDITSTCSRVTNPVCYYLGGQPGSGKSVHAHKIKKAFPDNNVVIICFDNYRSYHPNYLKIEELIKKHWENRVETNNDSMGNDIADFTHHFASMITDELAMTLSDPVDGKGYNIVFDWGLRFPKEPLEIMTKYKRKGYRNEVLFIVVSEDISREACKLRSDVVKGRQHLIRKVCDDFHDLCVSTLPDSASCIYRVGTLNKIVDNFALINRNKDIVWDKNSSEPVREVYYNYLHDKSLRFTNNIDDMVETYNEETRGFQL